MHVAFANENTLGHASYLRRYARSLAAEFPVHTVEWIDATPLPASLSRWGDVSIPLLRRWNMDLHGTRWRLAASRHVAAQLNSLHRRHRLDAVVANTQSIAFELHRKLPGVPVLVALDATFAQLFRSEWFARDGLARWLLPITCGWLSRLERNVLRTASLLLPWSERAATSLRNEYSVPQERIAVLPPSVEVPPLPANRRWNTIPKLLFVGGDFRRKGGPLLLETFRRFLAGRASLAILTQTDVPEEPGVKILRGITAGDPNWRTCWENADAFVFPSQLETFGIVLVEALAFSKPVIASKVGAAEEILDQGRCGWLLESLAPEALACVIAAVLENPDAADVKAVQGWKRANEVYNLRVRTSQLATLIERVVNSKRADLRGS